MKYHLYTEMWPLLNGKAFEELKSDIAANGQRMPVLTYQDMILDGRNRERACAELGIAARYEPAQANSNEEALNLVVSLNTHRRHLTAPQRAFAGEKLAKLKQGTNQFVKKTKKEETSKDISSNSKSTTIKEAAAKVGSNKIAVVRARAIRTYGTDADVEDVVSGKVPLSKRAAELVKKAAANKPPRGQRTSRKGKSENESQTQQKSKRSRYAVLVNRPRLEDALPTREQVDPEFKGDSVDFAIKYGNNPVMTALQYATMYLGTWTSNVKALAKEAKKMPDWPEVDHNWLRAPKPYDVTKLAEALAYLRPKLAEAEKLLARAQEATKQKAVA